MATLLTNVYVHVYFYSVCIVIVSHVMFHIVYMLFHVIVINQLKNYNTIHVIV